MMMFLPQACYGSHLHRVGTNPFRSSGGTGHMLLGLGIGAAPRAPTRSVRSTREQDFYIEWRIPFVVEVCSTHVMI